jgi:hypothetical protein
MTEVVRSTAMATLKAIILSVDRALVVLNLALGGTVLFGML